MRKIFFITLLLASLTGNKSNAQNTEINEKEILEINQLVEEFSKNDKFSGTVLIAKGQDIIYQKAVGFANKELNNSNNMDTKFNLASMNKMFTGIAITQLVEQKKLSYKTKLCKILPMLPKKTFGKITIEQLLTHTAGTGDIFRNPRFMDIKDTAKTIDEYLKIGIDDPLWNKPGTKFEYSNYGYILLGAVIEKLTNRSYYDYVKKNIFEVAKMLKTDSYETDNLNVNLAIGYASPPQMPGQKQKSSYEKPIREPNTRFIEVKGTSAGGGYSTANDLHLFSMALLSGKLVSKQSFEMMTTGKVLVPTPINTANMQPLPQRKYGYGFGESFKNNIKIIGHNGGAPGVDVHFYIYPSLGYTLIVLSNYDRAGIPILNFIENSITNQNN